MFIDNRMECMLILHRVAKVFRQVEMFEKEISAREFSKDFYERRICKVLLTDIKRNFNVIEMMTAEVEKILKGGDDDECEC